MANEQWYYNVLTQRVERAGEGRGVDQLGPYPTREAAEHAVESVRAREKQLADEDERWRNWGDAENEQ